MTWSEMLFERSIQKSKIQFDDTNSSYSQSSNSTNVICIIPDLWNTLKKLPRSWSMYGMEMFICHGQSMGIKDSKGIGRPCCVLTLCEWAGGQLSEADDVSPLKPLHWQHWFFVFCFCFEMFPEQGSCGLWVGQKNESRKMGSLSGLLNWEAKTRDWKVSDSAESRVLQRAVPGTGMWVWGGSPHMLSGPETWI